MKKLISIVGTNGSGKSSLGIILAKKFNGEIVSADSRQVYKHLDLGTGKVTKDEMIEVKHHLIDILDLNQPFSVAEFQQLAYEAIDDIHTRNKNAFLVGGTGLYSRSVIQGYSFSKTLTSNRQDLEQKTFEELMEKLKELDITEISRDLSKRHLIRKIEKAEIGINKELPSKPKYEVLQLGLTWNKDILHKRITDRLDDRIQQGMIEEVKNLLKMGATPQFLERLGLEYRFTYNYLSGKFLSYEDYREKLLIATRQFAKRQLTWFRKEKDIIWLDTNYDYIKEAKDLVERFLKD